MNAINQKIFVQWVINYKLNYQKLLNELIYILPQEFNSGLFTN